MDQGSFEQLIRYVLMAIVVTGSFGLASGIVIWAIKSYLNLKTNIPRAKCGFVTMRDMLEHCSNQQAGCQKTIEVNFKAAIKSLEQRLKAGDKIFDEHRKRLRELEQNLTGRINDLTILHRELRILVNEKTSGERKQVFSP